MRSISGLAPTIRAMFLICATSVRQSASHEDSRPVRETVSLPKRQSASQVSESVKNIIIQSGTPVKNIDHQKYNHPVSNTVRKTVDQSERQSASQEDSQPVRKTGSESVSQSASQ